MKEKPKKMKVESRTSRTERSSFRERRSKEEREQFDSNKPRSNRGDRKERKPKKYDEKPKEVSFQVKAVFIFVPKPFFLGEERIIGQ